MSDRGGHSILFETLFLYLASRAARTPWLFYLISCFLSISCGIFLIFPTSKQYSLHPPPRLSSQTSFLLSLGSPTWFSQPILRVGIKQLISMTVYQTLPWNCETICLHRISTWMIARHNKLNISLLPKTCSSHGLSHLSQWQIRSTKILWVITDPFLLSFPQPNHQQTCPFYLLGILRIQPPLPLPLQQATSISCLDHYNRLLIDLLASTLAPLLSDLHTEAKVILLNVNLMWGKTLLYQAHRDLHNLIHLHSLPRALATWPFCSFLDNPSTHLPESLCPSGSLGLECCPLPTAPHHPDGYVTHSFNSSIFAPIFLHREAQTTLFKRLHTTTYIQEYTLYHLTLFHFFP